MWLGNTFTNGDEVTFNAIGGGSQTIGISTSVIVTDMIVNGGNYTFIGTGIGITAINKLVVKNGTGILTLNTANEFQKGITFEGGNIVLGHDKALGTWFQIPTSIDYHNFQGLVTVSGNETSTIQVLEDRTIKNRFIVGIVPAVHTGTESPTGSLIFNIASTKTLTIDGVTYASQNGTYTLDSGGAIEVNVAGNQGLTFAGGGNLIFSNNKANQNGGAVSSVSYDGNWTSWQTGPTSLDFTELGSIKFNYNEAINGEGGAIFAWGDVVLGNYATFTGNKANYRGGAISVEDSTSDVTIGDHATFTGNQVTGIGGAICTTPAGTVNLSSNTYFTGNTSTDRGGAINAGNIYVKGNTYFYDNKSSGQWGGAICATGTVVDLNTDDGDIAFDRNFARATPQRDSIYLSVNNTTLSLSGAGNIYFNDPISNNDGKGNNLTKDGTGFVQFVGNNNLNAGGGSGGAVTVNGGEFRVVSGASFANRFNLGQSGTAPFIVGTAGTLAGGGTIISGSFTLNGTISPDNDQFEIPTYLAMGDPGTTGADYNKFIGDKATTVSAANAIGTLTLAGPVTFSDTSTFLCDINSNLGTNDLIKVINYTESGMPFTYATGNVTINSDAKLSVNMLNGVPTIGQAFRIIDAPLARFLSGTTPAGTATYFQTTGRYDFEHLIDSYDDGSGSGPLAGYWLIFRGLLNVAPDATFGRIFMTLAPVDLQRSFQRQLPSAAARRPSSPFDPSDPNDPGSGCGPGGETETYGQWNRWATITGDWQQRSQRHSFSGYNMNSAGVAVGMDRSLSRNLFAGVAFGYDNAFTKLQDASAHDQIDVFRTMLYGGWQNGRTYADGYLGYATNGHKTYRDVAGFNTGARSNFNDHLFSTGFEFGRKLSGGFTPSVGLQYIHLARPDVSEYGSTTENLYIAGGGYDSVRLPLGVRWSRDYRGPKGIILRPELRAFYIRELADSARYASIAYDDARDMSTLSSGGDYGRNSGRFGTGVCANLTSRMDLRIDYDYEVYKNTDTSALSATLGVKW